jgi:hypothetical protein
MTLYILILICSHARTICSRGETALFFQSRQSCQRFADDFNKADANKVAGAEERCIKAFQAPQ